MQPLHHTLILRRVYSRTTCLSFRFLSYQMAGLAYHRKARPSSWASSYRRMYSCYSPLLSSIWWTWRVLNPQSQSFYQLVRRYLTYKLQAQVWWRRRVSKPASKELHDSRTTCFSHLLFLLAGTPGKRANGRAPEHVLSYWQDDKAYQPAH